MIKDAAKKQFTQVLIYKTDRFARNRFDAAIYKKKLKDYGVKVVPVKEPIPDGPGGVVMEALYKSMAQMYSENLSENVRRSNYSKAKPEKYLLSQKAFCGYCGKMLVGNSGCGHQGNKYRYYWCKGKRPQSLPCDSSGSLRRNGRPGDQKTVPAGQRHPEAGQGNNQIPKRSFRAGIKLYRTPASARRRPESPQERF